MFNACLRPIALYFLVMLPVVVLKFIEDKICVVSYSSINVELQCLQLIILSLAFFECGHNVLKLMKFVVIDANLLKIISSQITIKCSSCLCFVSQSGISHLTA